MKNFRGTNYRYGVGIDTGGEGGLTDDRHIPGRYELIPVSGLAAADAGRVLAVLPAACKLVKALERHVTPAGQAGTIQIEKVPSGTAPGSGTALLATAVDAAGTANTVQTCQASANTLAAGDALAVKTASGALTSLAGMTVTLVVQWS